MSSPLLFFSLLISFLLLSFLLPSLSPSSPYPSASLSILSLSSSSFSLSPASPSPSSPSHSSPPSSPSPSTYPEMAAAPAHIASDLLNPMVWQQLASLLAGPLYRASPDICILAQLPRVCVDIVAGLPPSPLRCVCVCWESFLANCNSLLFVLY